MNIFSSFTYGGVRKTSAQHKYSQNRALQTLGGDIHQVSENPMNTQEHSSFSSENPSVSNFSDKAKKKENTEENAENVGGQAVIEGIMMRHKGHYALAVRLPNKTIRAEQKIWRRFAKEDTSKKPFFRGFPLLVETLLNGIRTLNRSAELNSHEDEKPITHTQLLFTLFCAVAMALLLFVVVPHALSYLMQAWALSGDVESFSFQAWDGLFKFLVFFLYLLSISFLPDVRRVFQFHGAEHKVIAAYEACTKGRDISGRKEINTAIAKKYSRLHPRCGTTFLLFVLSIAILIHALFLPFFLWLWAPSSELLKHSLILLIKIALMIPISALAYELIRYTAKHHSFWAFFLKAPGLLLQLFTTVEPEEEHIEVALVALKLALGDEAQCSIITPNYILE